MRAHTLLQGLLNVALFVLPAVLIAWTDAPKRRAATPARD
jgi:hypothetical protein